jgi:hypothetical protein
VASALVNTAQQVGGSVGLALLNTIAITVFTNYLTAHSINPQTNPIAAMTATVHSYTIAFWVSAALMALAAIVAAVFIRARADQLHASEAVPAGV